MNKLKFKCNRLAVLALSLSLLIGACQDSGSAPAQTASLTDLPPTRTVQAARAPTSTSELPGDATPAGEATPPATLPAGADVYTNPVLDQEFADPDVLQVEETYYAYATNWNSVNIQVAVSEDLVEWQLIQDALPVLPDWALPGDTWAPEVIKDASGEAYLMYFTARFAIGQGGVQCIGVATGDKPEGPFRSQAEEPFICQTGEGGSIDASAFVEEDGTRYLLWKNDGNSVGGQTWIHIQRISEDGLTLLGELQRLFRADQRWEGIVVEGPTLWKRNGKYYLFYSANLFTSPNYAIGWAVADDPFGPYEKSEEPLLKTDLSAGIVGPGGQDVVLDAQGETWLLFHSRTSSGFRSMNLVKLAWDGEVPVVGELSREAMPAP